MSSALVSLVSLIGITPAILVVDGLVVRGLLSAILAIVAILAARSIRPGEAHHLVSLVRPALIVTAPPAIWMVLQTLPLPLPGLANPIWESAAASLGRPIAGSITIDTGATLLSLSGYLCAIAVAFVAVAVGIDRQRAEWTLFALTAATAGTALLLLAHDIGGFTFLDSPRGAGIRAEALDSISLGTVLSAAAAVRAFERYETRPADRRPSMMMLVSTIGACAAALSACIWAIGLGGGANTIFASAYGLATLASVVVIRRFGLGPWGSAGIAAGVIATAIAIVAVRSEARDSDLSLAFANPSGGSVALAQRILADGSWSGSGAGTFPALAPIYRDADDSTIEPAPPTAAAALVIEFGRPLLWLAVAAAAAAITMLFRAALRRGRDSFYPAAGAGCLVALVLLAFGNAGLFGSAISIVAATVLGVALAQSRSRSAQ